MHLTSSSSFHDGASVASAYSGAFGASTSSLAGYESMGRGKAGKAEQTLNSAVGLPLRDMLQPHGQPISPQRAAPSTLSRRNSFATSGAEILSPSRSQPLLLKGGSQQRLLAMAFDSDWNLKADVSPEYLPSRKLQEQETKRWLSKVLGSNKKKKKAKSSILSFAQLSPVASPRLKLAKLSAAWNPLHSLQVHGLPPEDVDAESEICASLASEEEEIETTAATEARSKQKRRRSINLPGGSLTIPGPEESTGANMVALSDIAHTEGVPYDLCKQALCIFLEFAPTTPAREKGLTPFTIAEGRKFEVDDLGSLDEELFEQICCKIADVKSVEELGEEFMETAMASADRNSSNDIDYVEFLAFYQQFSFSEEVLIAKEERQLRKIARKYGLNFVDLDKFKAEFDKADTDKSGEIEYDEFCQIVLNIIDRKSVV